MNISPNASSISKYGTHSSSSCHKRMTGQRRSRSAMYRAMHTVVTSRSTRNVQRLFLICARIQHCQFLSKRSPYLNIRLPVATKKFLEELAELWFLDVRVVDLLAEGTARILAETHACLRRRRSTIMIDLLSTKSSSFRDDTDLQ